MTDWEECKQAVWQKVQSELHFYAPRKVKEQIEKNAGAVHDEVGLEDYEGTVRDFMQVAKLCYESHYFNSHRSNTSHPKKRYQRCFQKQLYVVDFVMSQRFPVVNGQVRPPSKRINWKQTCEAWNRAHPNDPMSLDVLKVKFYRALASEDVKQEHFRRRLDGIVGANPKDIGRSICGMGITPKDTGNSGSTISEDDGSSAYGAQEKVEVGV